MRYSSSHDLMRIKKVVEFYPDSNIILMVNKIDSVGLYWEPLKEHLGFEKEPWVINNNPHSLDGIPINNSIVLMCGPWWQNTNAIEFLEKYIGLFLIAIPVTHIPFKDEI